jgi:hypothetical protein
VLNDLKKLVFVKCIGLVFFPIMKSIGDLFIYSVIASELGYFFYIKYY